MSLRSPSLRQLAAIAIALALAASVAWSVHRSGGVDAIAATATRIPPDAWQVFASVLLLAFLLRAVRLWRLLRGVDANASFPRACAVFFTHNMVATLVPARAGEAALPFLAQRWAGVDWAAALGVLAWWRVVDLAVGCALALTLLAAGLPIPGSFYGVAAAACFLPLLLFAARFRFVRYVDRHDTPLAHHPGWVRFAHRVAVGMPRRLVAAAADLVLALAAWCTKLAAFGGLVVAALAAYPTGASPIALPIAAAAALAGDAAGSLPVPALGGVGPFEGAVTLALASVQVPEAPALAAALLLHAALLASVVATGTAGALLGVWLGRVPAKR
jgi:uncharacterized membrane protein YbhN (UPF0104 family)